MVDMEWASYFDPAERGGSTASEIASHTGRNIQAVRRKIGELIRDGVVKRATKRVEAIDGTYRSVSSYIFTGGEQ